MLIRKKTPNRYLIANSVSLSLIKPPRQKYTLFWVRTTSVANWHRTSSGSLIFEKTVLTKLKRKSWPASIRGCDQRGHEESKACHLHQHGRTIITPEQYSFLCSVVITLDVTQNRICKCGVNLFWGICSHRRIVF